MTNPRETLLCRYHYTPLDQLAACTVTAKPSSQRFYLKERLSTEIRGALQHSIMQHEDHLLAQQQSQAGTLETRMIATDQQRSVLALLDSAHLNHFAYSPYGHRGAENGLLSLLGFNGERPDPVTGHYLLGNGYRAFNPVLMRFNSPDSWSPFGEGGLNTYMYCVGDPVNQLDPNGHAGFWGMMKFIGRKLGVRHSSRLKRANTFSSNSATVIVSFDAPDLPPLPFHSPSANNIQDSLPNIGPSLSQREANPLLAPTQGTKTNRTPMGNSNQFIEQWVNTTHNLPDAQLALSTQIPRPGARPSRSEHLAIQYAGKRVSLNMHENSSLYAQGNIPNSLENLRTRFYDKQLSQIRKN